MLEMRLAAFCTLLTMSQVVTATCYSLFDPTNQLIYQSEKPPFDVSGPISDATRAHFPGHFLIATESAPCPYVNEIERRENVKPLPDKPWDREPVFVPKDPDVLYSGFGSSAETQTTAHRPPGAYPRTAGGSNRHAGTAVHVEGYTRKDGTSVSSHTRAKSRR